MSINLSSMVSYYKNSIADYAEAPEPEKANFLGRDAYPFNTRMINEAIKKFRVTNERTNVFGGVDFLVFNYKGLINSKYFVFFNLKSDGFDEEVLKEAKITIKSYTSINILPVIYSGRVKINKLNSPIKLANEFIYQHQDASFTGHDHLDVMSCFDKFHILKIDCASVFFDEKTRTNIETALYILSNHIDICNAALWNKREHYEKFVFSQDFPFLRYAGLLSLTSHHLTHSFLEVYKCFEYIYALPRCLDLKDLMKPEITKKAIELQGILSTSLGWERKEKDSIIQLFSKMDNNILSDDSMKAIIDRYSSASVVKINGEPFNDWANIIGIYNDYNIKKNKLAKIISALKMQRKQNSASYKRVKRLDESYTKILSDLINTIDNIKKFSASHIYSTRCKIAHLGDLKDMPSSNKEWVELITISITVAESIFSKYRHELI